MWSIIIVAIVALIAIVSKTIYDGEFIRGEYSHNLFVSLCCVLLTAIITFIGFGVTFFGSLLITVSPDISHKLVNTENYYLAEIVDNKYVSISSNDYSFATKEDGIIHYQQITATESNTIKICEDVYAEDEYPMVFIDHYVVGGTFFLDNFTFCNQLTKSSITTFYIPKDSVGTFMVEIK